jgi:NADPH2:quinone reductase
MTGDFDFDLHARKRIEYIGVTFRTRTVEEVREIVAALLADLWGAISDGMIRLPIDRTYPLADAAAAHERMRTNQHFGKMLLIP